MAKLGNSIINGTLQVSGATVLNTPLSIASGGTGANTVEGILNNLGIADYIVDQGTSDIWTYEKWASGKAVCWGYFLQSVDCTSIIFGGYSKVNGLVYELPEIFKSVNCATSSACGDGFIGFSAHTWANTTKFFTTPVSPTSGTKTFGVNATVKGTWK